MRTERPYLKLVKTTAPKKRKPKKAKGSKFIVVQTIPKSVDAVKFFIALKQPYGATTFLECDTHEGASEIVRLLTKHNVRAVYQEDCDD